ncbi:MAG TPA: hypothetical protein VNZ03_18095 [Terriglobales bacterium]|jgi:hypothetical protein|nr:hypothetical protein [Terriglobales bacterium]
MNVDLVYSYLIDFTWLFLGSWVVLLLTAAAIAFADWSWPRTSLLIGTMRRN